MPPEPTATESGSNILAYFSHSYRAEDREVNSFFWDLFHEEGFFFTVDPQSQLFSIPYLESMMMLSNCFVAVITRRVGAPHGCSPYILFEYGLAVQAQKPALVFVEQGLSGSWFPRDPERIVPFNRQRLTQNRRAFIHAIQVLGNKVRGDRNPDVRLQQPCGLIVRSDSAVREVYTPDVIDTLKTELRKYDRDLEIVTLDFDVAFEFCLELDKYDFLIMEVRESLHVPWLAGYVLGRAMPSITLCHVAPGEARDTAALPPIVGKHKPEHTKEDPVIFWQDTEELVERVTKHVSKFSTERIEFHTKDAGLRYFSRAGRREAKVFVSNANYTNHLAHKLIVELRVESIDFFHYQVKDAIPIGDRWLAELERQIGETGIFVALITRQYLDSPWCRYELQAARKREAEGKLRIHPYILEQGLWDKIGLVGLDVQARDYTNRDEKQIVTDIVADLDIELKKKRETPASGDRARDPETPVQRADVDAKPAPGDAFILSEKDRRTLVDVLAARLTNADGVARPLWVKGWLMDAELYKDLAGEDYSGSAEAVAMVLVTRTEALGVMKDGHTAIWRLVTALRDRERLSNDALPFLNALARRIERRSSG